MGIVTIVGKRPAGATREEALRLKLLGLSYGQIGKLWNVSRQRVQQIAKGKPKVKA